MVVRFGSFLILNGSLISISSLEVGISDSYSILHDHLCCSSKTLGLSWVSQANRLYVIHTLYEINSLKGPVFNQVPVILPVLNYCRL
jgi:hypothetical protein